MTLTPEGLAEIRRSVAEIADYTADGLMTDRREFKDRADLLAEVDRLTARAEQAEERRDRAEATINRTVELAKDMRTWSSPVVGALPYSDRLAETLLGADGPMRPGEALAAFDDEDGDQ